MELLLILILKRLRRKYLLMSLFISLRFINRLATGTVNGKLESTIKQAMMLEPMDTKYLAVAPRALILLIRRFYNKD